MHYQVNYGNSNEIVGTWEEAKIIRDNNKPATIEPVFDSNLNAQITVSWTEPSDKEFKPLPKYPSMDERRIMQDRKYTKNYNEFVEMRENGVEITVIAELLGLSVGTLNGRRYEQKRRALEKERG